MKSLFIMGSFLVLISCNEKIVPLQSVHYGTSFGHCLGYCLTETYIDEGQVIVKKIRRGPDADTITNSSAISKEKINTIIDGVDFGQFENLPETIGCPDCADGGAEWLELTYGKTVKKVTFEYGDDIKGIAKAVNQLRKLTEELSPDTDSN